MTRTGLMTIAALAGFALASGTAHAFTIVNQANRADGGSRVMLTDPGAAYGSNSQPSSSGLFNRTDGYGGYGAFDFSAGSSRRDSLPGFPGGDNHLTPGANVGILQYGAIPGR